MISIKVSGNYEYVELYTTDLKLLGLFEALRQLINKEEILILEFCDKYLISSEELKVYLYNLKEHNILNYQLIDSTLIINLENSENEVTTNIGKYFGINNQIVKDFNYKNNEQLENEVLNYILNNKIKVRKSKIKISTEEELIEFLKESYVQEIFSSRRSNIEIKDVKFLLPYILQENLPLEIINFVIDYSIKTNYYGSFNHKFAEKMFDTVLKKDIQTVKQALEFIDKIKSPTNEKYEEPKWQVSNKVEEISDEKFEEMMEKW